MAKAYDSTGNVWTSSTTSVNIPAKVTVTTPAEGSTVSGTITSFTATFSEPISSQGYLLIDGYTTAFWTATPGATSVTFPYTWNTTGYLNGTSHVIEVWGYTQSGYIKSIGTSTVIVNN